MYGTKIVTASNLIRQQYPTSSQLSNDKNVKILLEREGDIYLTKDLVLEFLELAERSLEDKDLDFRRKSTIELGNNQIDPEIKFQKLKGSRNKLFCQLRELENYILKLHENSIDLFYNDAKFVVEQYDKVLIKPKKYGMRGQRNFTGKLEDEIRGKLAEQGFSKYINNLVNLDLPVDYSSLTNTSDKRDSGDFTKVIINKKFYDIPKEYQISLKSTKGNYLAIPEEELQWEGNIFILAKLHIKETFLYKAIKAGLQLDTLNLQDKLGWLEIRGFITKDEFLRSHRDSKLPDGTDFNGKINLIRAASQLNQNLQDLKRILENLKVSI